MTITESNDETKVEGDESRPVDEEVEDKPASDDEGTAVAGGSYVVPKGVAVEKLKSKAKLRDECPDDLHKLLTEKELFGMYDRVIQAILNDKNTKCVLYCQEALRFFDHWKQGPILGIVDLFQDDFAVKGVKVVYCKRKSGKGTYRWFEFIDKEALEKPYVPQYDVSNLSGQIIKTIYTKIEFPNGVAAEKLKQWKKNDLKEKCPIYVETMLKDHDLMAEYDQMVDHVMESGSGEKTGMWNIEKLKDILNEYKPMFAKKGIDLFICHKQEYVSHGQHGGHNEYYRWIEFVDRSKQPSYQPQRDAEEKDEKCTIM
ncbi:MAG: hypothetical protein SGARI_003482 [Bacillariaceae sp.]